MSKMTRDQAIDFFVAEVSLSLNHTANSQEEYDAGVDDMRRAFEALGVDRKEMNGEQAPR